MGLRFEGYAMLVFLVVSILIIGPACNKAATKVFNSEIAPSVER